MTLGDNSIFDVCAAHVNIGMKENLCGEVGLQPRTKGRTSIPSSIVMIVSFEVLAMKAQSVLHHQNQVNHHVVVVVVVVSCIVQGRSGGACLLLCEYPRPISKTMHNRWKLFINQSRDCGAIHQDTLLWWCGRHCRQVDRPTSAKQNGLIPRKISPAVQH